MERDTEDSGIGAGRRTFSLADLPPPDTQRWVIRRKAAVVAAVQGGLLSLEEACARYRLSRDEYRTWERGFGRFGLSGLRATRATRISSR